MFVEEMAENSERRDFSNKIIIIANNSVADTTAGVIKASAGKT